MKRLLMITSAVGLCLAAPAFAQSTTDQDQLNKQKANQPSSSAPASQATPSTSQSGAQNKQQPSGGSSAQAPASQSQSGQAQSQQPASGSSSSSAQAPASSSQSPSQSATGNQNQSGQSQSGQAQNQQKPASSSTNAQAPAGQQSQPAQSGQAQNQPMQKNKLQDKQNARSRDTMRDRSSASLNVNINEQQRTRIATVLSSSRVRPITNVNFRLDVGIAVPRAIVLHTLPPDIVTIAPEFRGYRYFVTSERIVIVEPRRKTIVAVLPAGGTARAQAPAANKMTFTDQQREIVRKRAPSLRSTATTGSSSSRLVIEQEVPATIELEEFPAEIVTEVPTLRPYRYYRQDNDVLVIDPTQRRVIEIIR